MNQYIITWAVVISNEVLSPPHKKWQLDETIFFSRIGANTLLAPFQNKERAQFCALKLMQKYKFAGKIICITDKQFNLKKFVGIDIDETDIENFAYSITIYTAENKLILPVTRKQIFDMVKVNESGILITDKTKK